MKKLLSLMLAALLIVGLTACGGGNGSGSTKSGTQELGIADIGMVTVPKGDWDENYTEEGFVSYYNMDNDLVLDIFNPYDYAVGMTLEDMGEYMADYYYELVPADDLEVNSGKFGSYDAMIITGTYIDEIFEEDFEVYGWVFEYEEEQFGAVMFSGRPDDVKAAKAVADGTFKYE